LPGAFARAGDIVQFYASLVGPFPYEKLAHLQSETRFGGMENATAIFYSDQLLRRGGITEGLIAHETAHQWFGDAVTEKLWPHVWLSEGFATYFAALYTQHAHGDSAFRAEMGQLRSQILADTVSVPKRPVIDSLEPDLLALLNVNSYQKGAFVLHMLRSELGDSVFFRGLRDYFSSHKHGSALTGDLRVALEHVSGRDLRGFFNQWLRRPGYPDVGMTWTTDPQQGTVVTINQGGKFGYFDFTMPIVVVDANGAGHPSKISVTATPTTRVQVSADQARQVIFDPDITVLMANTSGRTTR
jgi:aminopeptidase N